MQKSDLPQNLTPIVEVTAALRVANLSKTFEGTVALNNIALSITPGEIHALIGQNGSGKSTFVKVLAGYHSADHGSRAWIGDEEISITSAASARHDELRFVHQDLGLISELNTIDNLALRGQFLTGFGGRILWKRQTRRTIELLDEFGAELDIRRPLADATPIQRTIVAVCAALSGWDGGSGVLVLDEPTAVLPPHEVERLFEIVNNVRSRGASVLYVSHRLDEIFRIADRVTVLRDGEVVTSQTLDGLNVRDLAEMMVGRKVETGYRVSAAVHPDAPLALEARQLAARYLGGVDFEVRQGEILGLAGLPGSGADEMPYLLAGAVRSQVLGGQFRLAATDGQWRPIEETKSTKLPLAPADRARDGVVADFSVAENISLSTLSNFARGVHLSAVRERTSVSSWIKKVQVKASSPDVSITALSGGNQQKVVIARCLTRVKDVLLLSEPTAGVDVGTRQAIYELIATEAANGVAVVVASTDTGDLLALCSRVLVLVDGQIVRELVGDEITEPTLVHAMVGH